MKLTTEKIPVTGFAAVVAAFTLVAVVLVVGAIGEDRAIMAMRSLSLETKGEIPPIDRETPGALQTATFALG